VSTTERTFAPCDSCGKSIRDDLPDHRKAGKIICLDCQVEILSDATGAINKRRQELQEQRKQSAQAMNFFREFREACGEEVPQYMLEESEWYRQKFPDEWQPKHRWPWDLDGLGENYWLCRGLATQCVIACFFPASAFLWCAAAWCLVVFPIILHATPRRWWRSTDAENRLMFLWYLGSIPFAIVVVLAYRLAAEWWPALARHINYFS
jgi:hypothetical protein